MNRSVEPVGGINHPGLRLDTGLDVLDGWAARAGNEERNAVYAALFAMADRTLMRTHRIADDAVQLSEFFVLLDDDLVVKLRVHSFDSFGVVYVGPAADAPGTAVRFTRKQGSPPGQAAA